MFPLTPFSWFSSLTKALAPPPASASASPSPSQSQSPEQLTRHFTAWLRRQPRSQPYNYADLTGCPYASFLKSTGRARRPYVGGTHWHEVRRPASLLPPPLRPREHAIPPRVASALSSSPHTYGALLARLTSPSASP